MPRTATPVFRKLAILSGLVTESQIEEVILAAVTEHRVATPAYVADELLSELLLEARLLTPYQVAQLRAGRTKLTLGPYIITDWIGQGGMGQVFKGVHRVMGRECAVKVLPVNKSTPDAIANFAREIRTQARLDHPNLVRAYDAGHDGKVHYLVVEYVPGADLRRLVRSQGPLPLKQAANIISQAARGLEYAHSRGLIHRDVKPGNILVTPDGLAKVSDLGLAGCTLDTEDDPRAGKVVGTADYLSPEQIKTPQQVTPASDIYSLGCTLYYAITGKVPFPGGSTGDKARRHCEEIPWHPRRFNPDVTEEFVDVIADMMDKNPAARLQSAADVVARLEPWAAENSPLSSSTWGKSAWLPPPVTSDGYGGDDAQETDPNPVDMDEADSSRADGHSQQSQATEGGLQSGQETRSMRSSRRGIPPPPGFSESSISLRRSRRYELVLAVAVAISMFLGALAGFVIRGWLE